MRPNGLNINEIIVKYGGKQPLMRLSILDSKGCYGPYHDHTYKLQLGSVQSMQFDGTDDGPCYLSASDREKCKEDIDTGKYCERDILKAGLI